MKVSKSSFPDGHPASEKNLDGTPHKKADKSKKVVRKVK